MKMNTLEKLAMNNPVRLLIQRHFELPLLQKLGGRLDGMHVLEVGCGRGVGTELLLKQLGAASIHAIDLDESMLKHARKRLAKYDSTQLKLEVGDVTAIDAPNHSYDAVVNFAAIHHVPNWQAAVAEIARVLKPDGRFFFQEVTSQWIHRWPYSVLFEHPKENRFSSEEFVQEVERQGIAIDSNWEQRGGGDFIFGVGRRNSIDSQSTGAS